MRWCRGGCLYVLLLIHRSIERALPFPFRRLNMMVVVFAVVVKKRNHCQLLITMPAQIHRPFDPYDILANFVGSALALSACTWYHKRMLERRRAARGYAAVVGIDDNDDGNPQDGHVELGVVRPATAEDELERWEEGEEWETAELEGEGEGKAVAAAAAAG